MIGDASGKPGDFSDSDRKCTENFGIDYIDIRDFLLRLDEYYSIISGTWEGIESYMPKDMVKELLKFELSHNYYEISDYLENLYSYIEIIDSKYNINDIDLEKSFINYTAIIKIKDKYYSFDWYDTEYWDFDEQVNADKDLIEVFPKEVTTIIYK